MCFIAPFANGMKSFHIYRQHNCHTRLIFRETKQGENLKLLSIQTYKSECIIYLYAAKSAKLISV